MSKANLKRWATRREHRGKVKRRTPLVRLVADLLYNELWDFVECCGLAVQMFDLL